MPLEEILRLINIVAADNKVYAVEFERNISKWENDFNPWEVMGHNYIREFGSHRSSVARLGDRFHFILFLKSLWGLISKIKT